jgi:DNA-binding transcriptional LysR family regulator
MMNVICHDEWEGLMDTRHLNSFIALAEEGQFTAAARRMSIVQSGLSVTIKEMEEELGVQLVNRTTRSVSLTPEGETFLEYARASVSALKDGIQAVRSEDGIVRGRLHLGILQSLTPYIDLPKVLSRFREQYPEVEFAVESLSSGEIPHLVRSGYVDLSFNAVVDQETWPGVKTIPFIEDELVAICAKSHPLASSRTISLQSICQETFVDLSPERALRKLIDGLCASRSIKRESVYQVTNVDTLLQFVAAGLGVAIVPSGLSNTRPHASALRVLRFSKKEGALPKWRVVIITRSQRRAPGGKKSTIDLFLATLEHASIKVSKFSHEGKWRSQRQVK